MNAQIIIAKTISVIIILIINILTSSYYLGTQILPLNLPSVLHDEHTTLEKHDIHDL